MAHLITSLAMGGAERFLTSLLPALGELGAGGPLYLLNEKAAFFPPPAGIKPRIVGFNAPWRDVGAVLRATRALRRFLVEDEVDILHTHLWLCDFLGALAIDGTHVRHVSHVHNTLGWMNSSRFGFRLRTRIFAHCLRRARTRSIFCSRAAARHLRAALPKAHLAGAVIPYCIDVNAFPCVPLSGADSPSPGVLRIGMAGRHVPSKGHRVLIEALRLLEAKGMPLAATIAGDGEERQAIASHARERLRRTPFEMIGLVRDMPVFFRGIDVLVQPSLAEEGLPVTILEAMCSGIPVIASDDAGAPEIIRDGVSGFLVPRGDAIALARRISDAAGMSRAELAAIGQEARRTVVTRCSIPAVAASVAKFYAAMLAEETAAPAAGVAPTVRRAVV